jgi:MraZ protein
MAYPMAEWEAFEERLSKLPQFDPTVATLRRLVVSGAVECELDKLGRVLVPQVLRQHARLEREALWAGMGKHIELWSKPTFDAMRSAVLDDEATRAQMATRLSELGL